MVNEIERDEVKVEIVGADGSFAVQYTRDSLPSALSKALRAFSPSWPTTHRVCVPVGERMQMVAR